MGCGASVQVQGTSPLPPGSVQETVQAATKNSAPAPLAEDIQAGRVPEVKGDVGQSVVAKTAGGAPDPAASTESQSPASPQKEACISSSSTELTSPNFQCDDALPPGSPRSNTPEPASIATWGQDLAMEPPQEPSSPRLLPPQSRTAESAGSSQEATRLVLDASTASERTVDLERPTSCSTPCMSSGIFDPAVTPSSASATVTLLPEAPGGYVARARYTDESDLSISSHSYDLDGRGDEDSDEDELAALFTLQAWKRYYSYNKRKHADLLTYFWRKFPPQEFSCFCISYRNQELLVTSFMAENCIHGYCARLEDLGLPGEVFLQMYVLHDSSCDQYHIVGLLLVAGQALPPALASLSAFDGFVYHRADTTRTLVKQFVSGLLVGMSPLHSLKLVSGREMV